MLTFRNVERSKLSSVKLTLERLTKKVMCLTLIVEIFCYETSTQYLRLGFTVYICNVDRFTRVCERCFIDHVNFLVLY